MFKILIADDDKGLRTNLKHFFSDEGYTVLLAANGAECYESARKNQPDVIISDVNMPVMNGCELMKKIQSDPVTKNIPVIFITGETDAVLNPEKYSGAESVITKPFRLSELLEVINRKVAITNTINNQ